MKAVYKDITSPKSFVHRRWEKSWLVCQREEGNPNNAVKSDATKTVQIKRNNNLSSNDMNNQIQYNNNKMILFTIVNYNLSSFQLHFIITFALSEPKLAHGPVKFPACLISHFVMNIIMAKTDSTAKLNSAK